MKHMIVMAAAALALAGCQKQVDPKTWTCNSLIAPIISMSKDNELQIFEITSPRRRDYSPPNSITCDGQAEWNRGNGSITYGARVSDGGQVILEYKQD